MWRSPDRLDTIRCWLGVDSPREPWIGQSIILQWIIELDSTIETPGKLPSLAALRAFESAARLGSIGKAAAELFVTPGAVSHQIKGLEEQLGFALFARQGRGIQLTADGQRLACKMNALLVEVAREISAIQRDMSRQRLVVTVLPSFAARWLTPRLGRFIDRHPDIELWIQTSKQVEDLVAGGLDLAIRMGKGNWPGLHLERFADDCCLVVASPHLVGGLPAKPADLAGRLLLRSDSEPWQPWFALAGLDWPEPTQGLVFNDSSLLVQAAIDGQGIAMARDSLVRDDIAAGRLVQLFDLTLPMDKFYWLVTPSPPPYRPALQTFVDWLREEIKQ